MIVKPEQPTGRPGIACQAKFISITANGRGVFALDEHGGVWFFDESADTWYRLSRTRAP